jgi:two-component system, NarL family, sensor histidine kinase BarA
MYGNTLKKPLLIIDPQVIVDYNKHSPTFIYELLDLFIAHAPKAKAAIIQAFHKKNHQLLKAELHKLKGACLYCGLLSLKKTIESSEEKLSKGVFSSRQLTELERELEKVIQAKNLLQHQDCTGTEANNS